MAKFKNVSPLGALDVPALGKVVKPGEVFEVDKTLAPHFKAQTDNFEPVTIPRSKTQTNNEGEDD